MNVSHSNLQSPILTQQAKKNETELQIRGGIEDNSKINFLICQ